MIERSNAVVIGAGTSGLATGYHLRRAGLRFRILESSDNPGGSWPNYYDSLRLLSPARYSSLPGLPFPGDPERHPARDEVTDYLRAYARHMDLPIETGQRVERVMRKDRGFVIQTAGGDEIGTRSVVVATGAFNEPQLPELVGKDTFEGEILHSADFRNPAPYHGKRVVVVGAGNSAVQIAMELSRVARVSIATRKPVPFRPQRLLGRDIHFWARVLGLDYLPAHVLGTDGVADSGRYREALARGKPDRRPIFEAFTRTGVVWADGTEERVDVVLFATGFRPRFRFLSELNIFDADGRVQHRKGVSTTTPGLYFVGLVGQRNFASATLRGSGPDARYVVSELKRFLARDNRGV